MTDCPETSDELDGVGVVGVVVVIRRYYSIISIIYYCNSIIRTGGWAETHSSRNRAYIHNTNNNNNNILFKDESIYYGLGTNLYTNIMYNWQLRLMAWWTTVACVSSVMGYAVWTRPVVYYYSGIVVYIQSETRKAQFF